MSTGPDKKLAEEDRKVEDAAATLEDATLTRVVADAAEDVAADDAEARAVASEIDKAL